MRKRAIHDELGDSDEDVIKLLGNRCSRTMTHDSEGHFHRPHRGEDGAERRFVKRKPKRVRDRTH